jgi:hypothetical protein
MAKGTKRQVFLILVSFPFLPEAGFCNIGFPFLPEAGFCNISFPFLPEAGFCNISKFSFFTSVPWLVVLTCGYARAKSTYLDSTFRLNMVWHC